MNVAAHLANTRLPRLAFRAKPTESSTAAPHSARSEKRPSKKASLDASSRSVASGAGPLTTEKTSRYDRDAAGDHAQPLAGGLAAVAYARAWPGTFSVQRKTKGVLRRRLTTSLGLPMLGTGVGATSSTVLGRPVFVGPNTHKPVS